MPHGPVRVAPVNNEFLTLCSQLMDRDNLENLGFDPAPEEVAQDPKAPAQPEGQTRLL